MSEVIWILIPICALMIPIVAILASHQQKMAEIIHRNQRAAVPNPEIAELKQEIQALKEIVHQQAIALDDRGGLRSTPPPAPNLTERLVQP